MLRCEEADEPALSQETPWQLHSVPYSTTTAAAPVPPVLRVLSCGSEWGGAGSGTQIGKEKMFEIILIVGFGLLLASFVFRRS